MKTRLSTAQNAAAPKRFQPMLQMVLIPWHRAILYHTVLSDKENGFSLATKKTKI